MCNAKNFKIFSIRVKLDKFYRNDHGRNEKDFKVVFMVRVVIVLYYFLEN